VWGSNERAGASPEYLGSGGKRSLLYRGMERVLIEEQYIERKNKKETRDFIVVRKIK